MNSSLACLFVPWATVLSAIVLLATASAQNATDGFDPDANGPVWAIAAQPDGMIILGGEFTKLAGTNRSALARLNADGNLDIGFHPAADGGVFSLAIEATGKIIVGGRFGT